MDLMQITDMAQLKAMAYDQILTMEQSKQNLANIQQRIAQIMNEPKVKEDDSNEA